MDHSQPPVESDVYEEGTSKSALSPLDSIEPSSQFGNNKLRPQEMDHIPETESTNQTSKILYRYLVQDVNGDILEKKESPFPFKHSLDDKATGLTDQTVLEVITTQPVSATLGRIDRKFAPSTVIRIHSLHLVNALRQIIRYYPGLSLSGLPVSISDPFMPLVHYMKELEEYKTNHPNGHDKDFIFTTNSHIDILLEFLEQRHGEGLRLERERHRRQPPVATFEYHWLLFRPGDQIFDLDGNKQNDEEEIKPHVVALIDYPLATSGKPLKYVIWNIDIDTMNDSLEPYFRKRYIYPFEGEKEVLSLGLCPRRLLPDYSQAVQKFIARGKKVVSLFEPSYMEYTGATIAPPSFELSGKIMVDSVSWADHSSYGGEHFVGPDRAIRDEYRQSSLDTVTSRGCECNVCECIVRKSETLPVQDFIYEAKEDRDASKILTDDFYLLCSPVVRGYALNEREWVQFHVDKVLDPIIDADPFSNLVLQDEIKDTIEALVCNYAQMDSKVESWGKDFVKDKGEGRIFLLHGSPGVGKTCTAECVADLIKRPLLPLTCGDMGVTASEVEKKFNLFFELGERWGAVVLMDEADIYLEQRSSENLERNSLVSVFLRSLEYFRGILFLTTNRVGSFDDAFISRIHVALHYKKLSEEYRAKIWEKNFNRMEKEGSISIAPGAIIYVTTDPDVRAVEWNGREIRNAFQTALALAQYQARKEGKKQVVLRADHLKRVVKMSRHFKDYITSTHKNQDEAKRAIIEERRNDMFGSS